MKKRLMSILVALALTCTVFGTVAFASAADEKVGGFETLLNVKGAGTTVTTAEAKEGGYTYETEIFMKGLHGQGYNLFELNLGKDVGTHFLKVIIQERDVKAYCFPQAELPGTGETIVPTGAKDIVVEAGWVLTGDASYKFKFVVATDWSNVGIFYKASTVAYPVEPQCTIDLTGNNPDNDYKAARITDGKAELKPNFLNEFRINSIKVDNAALDLSGDEVVLNNPSLFSKSFRAADFTVDSTTANSAKYVVPTLISTEGFEPTAEVFSISYRVKRGKIDTAAVMNTTADFGVIFGMKNSTDTYTSSGVGSFLNGATYGDTVDKDKGLCIMTVGKGNGTTAEALDTVGSNKYFRANDLLLGLVSVSLVGKANGDLVITYVESPGHEGAVTHEETVSGFDFNGYIALVCENSTIAPDDEIVFQNFTVIANEYIMPTSVIVDKITTTVKVGSSDTVVASVLPSDVTDNTVVWTTSDASIATVAGGVITGVSFGTATITATSTKDSTLKATVAVKVNKIATGITLDKTTITLNRATTQQLIATVAPADECDSSVTWTTSDETVATVENGLVTAIASGSATITATSVDGSFVATCGITVVQPVNSITLDKEKESLIIGGDVTLIATLLPSVADDKTVTWSSSNASVATVANGIVTAVSAGTAIITATAVGGDGITAECEITVTPPVVSVAEITLDKTTHTMENGDKITLVATVTPSNATNKAVVWKSSDDSIATVDANGKVTALKAGSVTITATAGDKSATCTFTINEKEKQGCGSSVGTMGTSIFAIMMLGGFVIITKKKSKKI